MVIIFTIVLNASGRNRAIKNRAIKNSGKTTLRQKVIFTLGIYPFGICESYMS